MNKDEAIKKLGICGLHLTFLWTGADFDTNEYYGTMSKKLSRLSYEIILNHANSEEFKRATGELHRLVKALEEKRNQVDVTKLEEDADELEKSAV